MLYVSSHIATIRWRTLPIHFPPFPDSDPWVYLLTVSHRLWNDEECFFYLSEKINGLQRLECIELKRPEQYVKNEKADKYSFMDVVGEQG